MGAAGARAAETLVPFTDIPENVRWETPPDRRLLDVRTIDGPFTPKDKFATTQHYGHPVDRPGDVPVEDFRGWWIGRQRCRSTI